MPRSDPSPDSDLPAQQPTSEATGPRVWRACLPCRRKKIKCDGRQPCHNCSSRNQDCEVTQSNDNASASRNYAASFEVRCQEMATLCERLETLTGQLTRSIDALNSSSSASAPPMGTMLPATGSIVNDAHADLLQAAHVLRSMPELRRPVASNDVREHLVTQDAVTMNASPGGQAGTAQNTGLLSDLDDDELDSASDILEEEFPDQNDQDTSGVGALVRDSYGDLRFVGGSSNHLLIEAAHSASPNTTGPSPQLTEPGSGGSTTTTHEDRKQVDIPLFYITDLLTRLFFNQLHYTFPVLFKPRFIQRYRRIYGRTSATAKQSEADDQRFLIVFFAVYAYASSLLPPNTASPGFPGLEYYKRALLLHYASTGEASLERV
ncbi:hypothetical protein F5X68DRAFT_262706 [Plectosphaerella plurivora]|uniref:Zn(2)-C6 fungal-type domain-containing protein n=1 Tax=Plectosphaerella plurivora TaxID=936078 RepID=A0A9P8V988_9PEZI|nr:hypothetical protein F5X68DRAFT_262706 [Plectosphaerella plurivora]